MSISMCQHTEVVKPRCPHHHAAKMVRLKARLLVVNRKISLLESVK